MQGTAVLGRLLLHAGHGTEHTTTALGDDGSLVVGGVLVLLTATAVVWYLSNRR